MQPVEALVWIFVAVFLLTALLTLGGIVENMRFVNIPERYLKGLYAALLMQIATAGVAIAVDTLEEDSPPPPDPIPESLTFTSLLYELNVTLDKLEKDDGSLLRYYVRSGDGERLFDGLYSNALFAAGASLTGTTSPLTYGNLYEWDSKSGKLRTKYFYGPYNDEVILRSWPVTGPHQGVASKAFTSGEIRIVNSTASVLKLEGEIRLKAFVSVPIPGTGPDVDDSQGIVLLHVDSAKEHVFPVSGEWEGSTMRIRIKRLAETIARINALRSEYLMK
ncbi:hypothetical protein H0Z60_14580 [Ectothiorhodospiraceae bacterium WFHF3C12]|nr:hypothetical protein [Ectothiorhodospiraceae bacterium WFHF3C12]